MKFYDNKKYKNKFFSVFEKKIKWIYYNHKHTINVEKDSLLSKLIPNKDKLNVNSFHHQAVKELAKGFSVDAKSDDGIIEAIHLNDESQWIFAVQWHPEQQIRISDDFIPLFNEFVKQAKIYRNKFK